MEREKTERILINHQWGNQSYRENLIKDLRNRQWEDQWFQVIWRAEQCQNRKLLRQNTQIRKPGHNSQNQFKRVKDRLIDRHQRETDLRQDLHKQETDLLTNRQETDLHKAEANLLTDRQVTDLHKAETDLLTNRQETDLHKAEANRLTDRQGTDLHKMEADLHKAETDLLTDRTATDLHIEEKIINLKLKHRLLRNRLVLISVMIKKKKETSLQSWKKERQKSLIL